MSTGRTFQKSVLPTTSPRGAKRSEALRIIANHRQSLARSSKIKDRSRRRSAQTLQVCSPLAPRQFHRNAPARGPSTSVATSHSVPRPSPISCPRLSLGLSLPPEAHLDTRSLVLAEPQNRPGDGAKTELLLYKLDRGAHTPPPPRLRPTTPSKCVFCPVAFCP